MVHSCRTSRAVVASSTELGRGRLTHAHRLVPCDANVCQCGNGDYEVFPKPEMRRCVARILEFVLTVDNAVLKRESTEAMSHFLEKIASGIAYDYAPMYALGHAPRRSVLSHRWLTRQLLALPCHGVNSWHFWFKLAVRCFHSTSMHLRLFGLDQLSALAATKVVRAA